MSRGITRAAVLAPLMALALLADHAFAADWLPVRESSLEVEAGSPLDFSALMPNPAITERSALTLGSDGRLRRSDGPQPREAQRLLCASLAWSPASGGFPDHDGADRYALQLKRHGYNLVRFHFLDAALMFGRKADFDFDPEVLDRVHYLMAALKRNGLYWMADGLSSPRGAYGGFDDQWGANTDLKLDVQINDQAFDHWLRFQQAFFARVNPYTGIAPIRDPALIAMVPFNENGIEFDSMLQESHRQLAYPPQLQPLFNAWLKARYGTTSTLTERWGWFTRSGRLEDGTVALPSRRSEQSERMRDFQAFLIDTEQAATRRMEQALRDLGFRGLVIPYNNWPTRQTNLSRASQQAVAMNTYFDWVGSYDPGTSIEGKSSLDDGLLYLRIMAASRWLGRPYFLTEYDHLFWNPYRYEAGLAVPAFAALQGWDGICRHGHGPIILSYGENYAHKKQMLPYAIALDPVARAGETLAAPLYRRGDVAPAAETVALTMHGTASLTNDIRERMPEPLTRLSLLAKLGMIDGGASGSARASLTAATPVAIELDATVAAVQARLLADRPVASVAPAFDLDGGRVDSLTGQIQMDTRLRQLAIETPQTVGLAFATLPTTRAVGPLTITAASGSGLLTISSLDDAPVSSSRRLLVILASDAHNSGMRFADAAERTIEDYGHLPVLIRKLAVSFTLAGDAKAWTLSPIGLDGRVKTVMAKGSGLVAVDLTNDLPDGPTTYFLIERQ